MGVKQWVRAMLVLAALPSSAFALGLGDIRLNSPLNAPLDAEIELVNATPDELSSLRVQLASRETFARYGLEWPNFLSSVTLVRAKDAAGRDVLRVRSAEAITEPFVTLLVDANWGRGRLVREYTLLLDPPVFAPTPTPAPAVQAPTSAAVRSGAVSRPASVEPAPVAAPAPRAETGSAAADTYAVRRGDTLSGISSRLAAERGASTEQVMVGLYRANRDSFDGTMNVLRAGAVLRIPDAASITAIDRGAALAEVRRQRSEWRSRSASASAAGSAEAAAGDGRLRLVPPSEGGAAGGAGDAAARDTQAMRERVSQLEKELSESKRLLEVRSAQIAELQQRLAGGAGTGAGDAAQAPAAAEPPPPVADTSAAPTGEAPATDAAAPAVPPAVDAAAAQPAAEQAAPKKKRARPSPPKPAAEVEEPSLVGSLVDSLVQFWWVLAGIAVLVAGLFGYRRWQAGRAAALDDSFGGATTTTAGELSMPPPSAAAAADTARLRRPNVAAPDKSGFVVEESGEFEAPRIAAAAAAPAAVAKSVTADDTLSGETGINLDQGDPLAEADFHMAYGLYDQAADLVRLAVAREPERRDLKLKLAEVFFVWGNRDEFLKSARELHATLGDGAAGEWDKIVIMGKQIAPEDPLFSGATARGGSSGLDLQLDGGAQPIDFDVFGDGSGSTQTIESAVAGSDLDFGPARRGGGGGGGGEGLDPTIERPRPVNDGADAPTVLVDAGGGTTREMAPQFNEAPTAESPRLDVDLDDFLDGAKSDGSDAPTIEQPALKGAAPTIRAKLDAALRQTAASGDQTAELAIDDLGLDLGDLEKLNDLDSASAAESAGGAEADDLLATEASLDIGDDDAPASPDAPTMLASFDEDAQRLIEKASTRRGNGRDIDPGATAALETLRIDAGSLNGTHDAGATSMLAALDTTQFDADAYDLGKNDASGVHKADADIDLDIGRATLPGGTSASVDADIGADVALPPLEPVTISEVGTKLDLARAYMDMGDPDGARNILREVLSEGSVSQKQEANRLLESLPG